jgi:histidine triad (HIT) family protein
LAGDGPLSFASLDPAGRGEWKTAHETGVFPAGCTADGVAGASICHPAPMSGSCLFCAIVRGEVPASFVLEEEGVRAFLDTRPVFKGHVLVIPDGHVADFHTLPADRMGGFWTAVQRVSRAVEAALGADGTFIGVNNKISQSVPHLHAHVVPRRKGDGLRGFFWPRTKYESDAEREDYARRIGAALT